jgi:hypothetical protein
VQLTPIEGVQVAKTSRVSWPFLVPVAWQATKPVVKECMAKQSSDMGSWS